MVTIAAKITEKDGSIDIKKIVDKHFDTIREYGYKNGWPINVGVVHDRNSGYVLADMSEHTEDKVLCQGLVEEDSDRDSLTKSLSSEINFLV